MRRSHRKSRYGCKECKQRHAKCDECRPVCGSCAAAKRDCSYLNSSATLPLPSPSPSASPLSRRPSTSPGPTSSVQPTTGQLPVTSQTAQDCPNGGENRYSILHLQLLHHLDHGFLDVIGPGQSEFATVLQMAKKEAFTAPFLMDELLALSAAHQSTLITDNNERGLYRIEATRLQTRAIAEYNAVVTLQQQESSSCHLVAIFLFSTFLGQHVLFDTLSSFNTTTAGHNLAAFLGQLVHCLSLQSGIAAVAGRSWPTLMAELRARLGPDAEHFHPDPEVVGDANAMTPAAWECAMLRARLAGDDSDTSVGGSELSLSSREACCAAVDALQRMFDVQQPPSSAIGTGSQPQFINVQKWLVLVPGEYTNLLARRQPEALVVLAYYAVMLHQMRGHWVVGNAGEALVRAIDDYLGVYWADWLKWPRSIL
ncbi:hypothetical protein B0T16DRAFT_395771 [Cercophora newfieldiana]|uniref:Zn(2)-C6 fungal-type domain-containing protein n=1 Tax=Cercophora newfieldiana TaxID=92897 RepID=A0AA39YLL8_9PEZI|nr:hypothetical protein B0T16DRAFT_395771 [Cercophora newfieldiana]